MTTSRAYTRLIAELEANKEYSATLRALVKEMTGALDALFEYPDNGTAVHPGALVWEDARTALAKAKQVAP